MRAGGFGKVGLEEMLIKSSVEIRGWAEICSLGVGLLGSPIAPGPAAVGAFVHAGSPARVQSSGPRIGRPHHHATICLGRRVQSLRQEQSSSGGKKVREIIQLVQILLHSFPASSSSVQLHAIPGMPACRRDAGQETPPTRSPKLHVGAVPGRCYHPSSLLCSKILIGHDFSGQ